MNWSYKKAKGLTVAVFLVISGANSLAQQVGANPHPPLQYLDQRDQAKVKRLSRQELEDLNAKLRKAVLLYYNRSYRLALPILEEIATRIDTLDVLYWLGRTAYEGGQYNVAITQFKTILDRNPNLFEVRLALAMAYIKAGDTATASAELQKLLAAKPPETMRQQAEQMVLGLGQAGKRFFATVRAAIGPQYDTNINAGPGSRSAILPGGTATLKQLEGWLIQSNFLGDVLYDFGQQGGFSWHSNVYFLHNEYLDEFPDSPISNFNWTQTDVRTALEYTTPGWRARMPVGFVDGRFSNKALSRSFYLNPSFEHDLTNDLDLFLGYWYQMEDYISSTNNAILSNVTHAATFGPRYHLEFGGVAHTFSLFGGYSASDANSEQFSYHDWSIGTSYFARFKTGTELYADLRYLDRNYDAPPFVQAASDGSGDRKDQRYTVTFALTQPFLKNYFASLTYTYIENNSSGFFYDYDKNLIGVNLGANFNF